MSPTSAVIVNPPHGYFRPEHLAHVIAEMQRRGPPVLRASWDAAGGIWHAREGTHRLRAAKHLGLTPVLVPVPWRRGRKGRVRARFAAQRYGHRFEQVTVLEGPPPAECSRREHRPARIEVDAVVPSSQ